jgi:hypothetical protein
LQTNKIENLLNIFGTNIYHIKLFLYHFLGVEMRNLQRKARENANKVFEENEKLRHDLQNKKKEIESRTRELDQLEAASESDKRRLYDEKQKVLCISFTQLLLQKALILC